MEEVLLPLFVVVAVVVGVWARAGLSVKIVVVVWVRVESVVVALVVEKGFLAVVVAQVVLLVGV